MKPRKNSRVCVCGGRTDCVFCGGSGKLDDLDDAPARGPAAPVGYYKYSKEALAQRTSSRAIPIPKDSGELPYFSSFDDAFSARRTREGADPNKLGATNRRNEHSQDLAKTVICPVCAQKISSSQQAQDDHSEMHRWQESNPDMPWERFYTRAGRLHKAQPARAGRLHKAKPYFATPRDINLDSTKDIGFVVRESGRYGSHPSHDGFDDESKS
jgi:hypothetical protein